MWTVTKEEAVEVYARFWASRYGSTASRSARRMAASLGSEGDLEGHEAWNDVADAIERQQQERRLGLRQETFTPQS
jgi:hypothetical protein